MLKTNVIECLEETLHPHPTLHPIKPTISKTGKQILKKYSIIAVIANFFVFLHFISETN